MFTLMCVVEATTADFQADPARARVAGPELPHEVPVDTFAADWDDADLGSAVRFVARRGA
jgi:hypothetical protein